LIKILKLSIIIIRYQIYFRINLIKIERVILNESDDANEEGTDFIAEKEKVILILNSWLN